MNIERSIEIMKSLSDTSRLRVLNVLMEKSHYVEELAHKLNLASSTVSFHLKKLENAGLVKQAKEQYYIIYSINEELFNTTLRELTNFEDIEKFTQKERIEAYRQKVLRAFFDKNKLVRLPVQRKKRMIVLNEFIKLFKKNVDYPEDKVNEIIKELYEDYCLIRRLLIEEKIMKRKNQIYSLVKDKVEGESYD